MTIKSRISRLTHYLDDIEEGIIRIPEFQRDFVWGKKEKLELFDSLRRGYPIGTLLFWKPKQEFKTKNQIGPYIINYDSDSKSDFYYILDGFQRLSTLFGCLKNPNKTTLNKKEEDFRKDFLLYYDLVKEEFLFSRSNTPENTQIPVYILIDTFEFLTFSQKLQNEIDDKIKSSELIEKAKKLATTLIDYNIASIEINGGEIEEAVDIFSRINSKGSKISPDWMVSALTYNEDNDGFRLGSLIDDLLVDLKPYNFQNTKRELILQCIQSSFGKIYFDEKIKDLVKRSNFEGQARQTIISIKEAVKFLFEKLSVIEGKLLPYGNQLIFIAYFFNQSKDRTEGRLEILKKWFWVTTYSTYFTIYSLSKQRLAFEQFKKFVHGEIADPIYNDKPNIPFTVPDFPNNIYFGSVRAKALVLFLLNYSNDFKPVNALEVEGLKIFYLFKEKVEPKAVVPLIKYIAKTLFPSKPEDLSFLFLTSNEEELSKYLIDKEMIDLYNSNKIDELLSRRFKVIVSKETEFVKKYGMQYDELF